MEVLGHVYLGWPSASTRPAQPSLVLGLSLGREGRGVGPVIPFFDVRLFGGLGWILQPRTVLGERTGGAGRARVRWWCPSHVRRPRTGSGGPRSAGMHEVEQKGGFGLRPRHQDDELRRHLQARVSPVRTPPEEPRRKLGVDELREYPPPALGEHDGLEVGLYWPAGGRSSPEPCPRAPRPAPPARPPGRPRPPPRPLTRPPRPPRSPAPLAPHDSRSTLAPARPPPLAPSAPRLPPSRSTPAPAPAPASPCLPLFPLLSPVPPFPWTRPLCLHGPRRRCSGPPTPGLAREASGRGTPWMTLGPAEGPAAAAAPTPRHPPRRRPGRSGADVQPRHSSAAAGRAARVRARRREGEAWAERARPMWRGTA